MRIERKWGDQKQEYEFHEYERKIDGGKRDRRLLKGRKEWEKGGGE